MSATRPPIVFEWDDDDVDDEPHEWLVKKLLPRVGVAIIGGESGAGKTFAGLDLCAMLAIGEDWFGWRTKERVASAFLLGEGRGTIKDRIKATRRGKIVPALEQRAAETGELPQFDPKRLPITLTSVIGVNAPETLAELKEQLKGVAEKARQEYGTRLGIIVIDTMPACFQVKDENSAAEMTGALQLMQGIAQEFGVLVVATHHAGKGNAADLRGSSAIRASCDVILIVQATRDAQRGVEKRTITLDKTRWGETGWNAQFRLQNIEVRRDADNDPVEAAYVQHLADAPREVILHRPVMSQAGQCYMGSFASTVGECGRWFQPDAGGPEVMAVDREALRRKFLDSYPANGSTPEAEAGNKRRQFTNGEKNAIDKGRVEKRQMPDGTTLVWSINAEADAADKIDRRQ